MFTSKNGFSLKLLCALTLSTLVTGCAQFPRTLSEPSVISNTASSVKSAMEETAASELDIEAGFSREGLFMVRQSGDLGIVPARIVKNVTITESGVFDALRLIAKDAGLTLNIEGGINGSERFGSTSAFDVNGQLKDVLEELSESMGFFYSIRRNTLHIQQDQQFVIELPPALNEDNAGELTNTLQYLGAKDPYIDRMSRSLVFKTNRKSLVKIEAYLKKIRETRSLIVYDVNVFQVDLKDNSDTGIKWNSLGWTGTPISSVTGSGGTTGGGLAGAVGRAVTATNTLNGMGLVLSGTHFSIDSLITFLQTQGNVKAVARPRLAMISGTKGMLRVGQVTTFVSKVGSNSSSTVNQVTTETKDLRTGLELGLFGDFSDNTVYTRVGLSISEITRFEKVEALGTSFTLPQTADRELSTVIRARPGDMILLGGITIEKDSLSTNGGVAGTGKSKEVVRSELVLTLKARVINFLGKDTNTAAQDARLNNGPSKLLGVELKEGDDSLKLASPTTGELTGARKPLVVFNSGSFSELKKTNSN